MTKEELVSGKPFKVKGDGSFTYKVKDGSVYSSYLSLEGLIGSWHYEGIAVNITDFKLNVLSTLVGKTVRSSIELTEMLAA